MIWILRPDEKPPVRLSYLSRLCKSLGYVIKVPPLVTICIIKESFILLPLPLSGVPPASFGTGLFHLLPGSLRSALWMMAATKRVFQVKQRLAVREQLFLRCHLTVRRESLILRLPRKRRQQIRAQR